MTVVAKLDGVNDYFDTQGNETNFMAQSSWTFEARVNVDGGAEFYYGTSNNLYIRFSTSIGVRMRYQSGGIGNVQFSSDLSGYTGYNNFKIIKVSPSQHELWINDVLIETNTNDTSGVSGSHSLRYIGRGANFGVSEFFIEYVKITSALDSRNYDSDSSNHALGTPVLSELIQGLDATGVNMPTDGSAWVDLGGGVITDPELILTSIGSTLAFGTPTVEGEPVLEVLGIGSTYTVGAPVVDPEALTVFPSGVGSTIGIGDVRLMFTQELLMAGIEPTIAFGLPIILDGNGIFIPEAARQSLTKIAIYLQSEPRLTKDNGSELIMEWLVLEGITKSDINTMLFEYLDNRGYVGVINEKFYSWGNA